MPEITVGDTTPQIVSQRWIFDPQTGDQLEQIWEGDQASMAALGAELRLLDNVRCECSQHNGPAYRLRALYGNLNDGSSNDAVSQFEVVTEPVQLDLRNHPNVIAAATTTTTLALWWKQVKEAVEAGVPLSGTVDPSHQSLYNLVAAGVEAYEVNRLVLRQRITHSISNTQPFVLLAIERVYSTTALAGFGIPGGLLALLPQPPAAQANSLWGWRLRTQNTTIIPSQSRAESVREWVFASWSTLLYEHIT